MALYQEGSYGGWVGGVLHTVVLYHGVVMPRGVVLVVRWRSTVEAVDFFGRPPTDVESARLASLAAATPSTVATSSAAATASTVATTAVLPAPAPIDIG